MSSSCGTIEFLSGGTIQDSTIVRAEISGSTVSGSTIDNSTISNLAGIDEASAEKIVSAICELDDTILSKLAEALGLKLGTGTAPTETCSDSISTCVYGRADVLLGEPTTWVELDGKNIPAY